uniref:Uncharacterized protein n=1 Tax=Solanum tuberosum TaxID=4113 RepID=M1DF27_SOLTU
MKCIQSFHVNFGKHMKSNEFENEEFVGGTTRILVYSNSFIYIAIGPKTVARALQQRFYNRLICSRYYSSIVTVNVTVLESVAIGTSIATVFRPSIGTIILQQL